MRSDQPKKTIILNILTILKKYTDEEHPLSQQEIADHLEKDFNMIVGRKAIKRNLDDLMALGYTIEYREITRGNHDNAAGESDGQTMMTDFYLVRDLTDSELHLLIDSVLSSRFIPAKQADAIVKKLAGLSSVYFHTGARHISAVGSGMQQNKQLFHTVNVLDQAIESGCKVTFHYSLYGVDKQLHPHMSGDRPKLYGISPYHMVVVNGRYYLICSTNNHLNVSHYRVDKITDIKLTNEPSVPMREIKGLEHGLNLPKHLTEHMNMFIGNAAAVSFRFNKAIINEVVDTFGSDVLFSTEKDGWVDAMVTVNEEAMKVWALQHLPTVTVTQPQSLVEMIRSDLRAGQSRYFE